MRVKYYEGEAETYVLPLSFGPEEDEQRLHEENPRAIIAYLRIGGTRGILYDGVHNREFMNDILTVIFRRQTLHGMEGQLTASRGSFLKNWYPPGSRHMIL